MVKSMEIIKKIIDRLTFMWYVCICTSAPNFMAKILKAMTGAGNVYFWHFLKLISIFLATLSLSLSFISVLTAILSHHFWSLSRPFSLISLLSRHLPFFLISMLSRHLWSLSKFLSDQSYHFQSLSLPFSLSLINVLSHHFWSFLSFSLFHSLLSPFLYHSL